MKSLEMAKKEDFDEIASIYAEEFSKSPYNENWTKEKAIKKLNLFSKYCDIWKIVGDKKIVGFLIINPNQWCPGETVFGEEMAVKKEFQNKGLGTLALKEAISYYKNRGFKTFLAIINKDAKSMKVFEKLGIKQSKSNKLIGEKLR